MMGGWCSTAARRKAIHAALEARDGLSCRSCGIIQPWREPGSREGLTVDHVTPRSKGGANHISNLCVMCEYCNTHKGNADIYYAPRERIYYARKSNELLARGETLLV